MRPFFLRGFPSLVVVFLPASCLLAGAFDADAGALAAAGALLATPFGGILNLKFVWIEKCKAEIDVDEYGDGRWTWVWFVVKVIEDEGD